MNDFNKFIKTELNEQQRKAVKQKKGATLVVAGAGSGKTRVITARMANLILNENVDPKSIVALTFTNKAAGEMRERLTTFLKSKHTLPFVGTFHSYCLLLLKTNPQIIPYPTFSIIDSDDQQSLIKKILKKNGLEKQFSSAAIQHQISFIKNKTHINSYEEFTQPVIKEIYLEYESEKSRSCCLDFDDLLLCVLQSFEKNEEFKQKYQQRIRNILVDEYQDTNKVQHALLKNMALNSSKKFNIDTLCAVGDEDQSIYSWRGAVVTNMLQFQKDFKPVKLIKIEQNYRSVDPILQAANEVISNNKMRHPKDLWSTRKAKNRILALNCKSDYQETDAITTLIKSYPKEKNLNNIAIIYRTHFQSRLIEESFIRNSIGYNIVGGIRFYERKEIKDLLAYLRLVVNPFDKTSLIRILNTPARGLGAKFEEELFFEWEKNKLFDFKQILLYLMPKQPNLKAQAINDFLKIFENLEKKQKPSFIIDQILEKTNYLNFLRKTYDPSEYDTKSQNIEELLRSIYFFESKKNKLKINPEDPFYDQNIEKNVETFLHEVSLMQEKIKQNEDKSDQVQMMTMHAAKGLEFEMVIICGLEEGILPSSRSLNTNQELEEERRLFYVGVTRAKERLVLTHANYRNTYGQISDQITSRFLTEIPNKLFQYLDISQTHPLQIQSVISDWLGTRNNRGKLLTFNTAKTTTLKSKQKTFKAKTTKKIFTTNSIPWKKNQAVVHKKFGAGLVTKVEQKGTDEYFLTVLFKAGEKRVLSSFIKKI